VHAGRLAAKSRRATDSFVRIKKGIKNIKNKCDVGVK